MNPLTQHEITLNVPVALLPPALRPTGKHISPTVERTLPLSYTRGDFARAEWKLKIPFLGPGSAEFWSSGLANFQVAALLFVGLQRALPDMKPDDVYDLITFENGEYVERAVGEAVAAAFPDAAKAAKEGGPAQGDPLPTTNGGSEPGPSADTTST